MRFHPVLAIGLCLNAFNLICRHMGIYQRLPFSEKVRGFIEGLILGATIALLLFGLILSVRPELMDQIREWKMNLFGGN